MFELQLMAWGNIISQRHRWDNRCRFSNHLVPSVARDLSPCHMTIQTKGIAYKVKCRSCHFTYVRGTKRSWNSRSSEHKPDTRNNRNQRPCRNHGPRHFALTMSRSWKKCQQMESWTLHKTRIQGMKERKQFSSV